MAGTISRDGVILNAPVLDAEIRSRMLDMMVAAFISLHPDQIRDAVNNCQQQTASKT